jgi:hypothetical protein
MRKRKRDDLWKCLFYLRNIAVFKGLGLHLVCEKERKIEWDAELDAKSVLASFRDDFRVVLGAKIVQTATWIDCMVCMRWRVRKARFSRLSKFLGAKRLTVF